MRRIPFLAIPLLLLIPEATSAKTLYVSKSGDGSDGLSWETGFNTIKEAIEATIAGDEIWVASGRYEESLVLPEGLSLRGGFRGELGVRDSKKYITLLDTSELFGGPGDAICATGEVLIEGFSITTGGSGTGVILRDSLFDLRDCVISSCSGNFGGGVDIHESTGCIDSCIIWNNFASSTGAGLNIELSDVEIRNCIIAANWAYEYFDFHTQTPIGGTGAGLSVGLSNVNVINCLLANNLVGFEGFGSNIDADFMRPGAGRNIHMVNSIIDNASPHTDVPPDMTISYSNVWKRGGPEGQGNIFVEPEFVNPDSFNFDYHLKACSRGIDEGTATEILYDADGAPRPVDIRGKGRDADGAFDMGPYEFQLKKSDLTRDGKVDAEDLLMFQEDWMREGEVHCH